MELESEMWSFTHGIVKTAAGSAYVESKTHKVLCTVSSPGEFSELSSSEEYQRHAQAHLSIDSPHNSHVRSALSSLIILERYPKSLIEIKVQIISGDEETALVYIINAASLAVIDSGIEIKDTLIAVNAGIRDGNIVTGVDDLVVGVLVNLDEIVMINQQGVFEEQQLILLFQACIDTAKQIFSIVKNNYES